VCEPSRVITGCGIISFSSIIIVRSIVICKVGDLIFIRNVPH
jgi:hypothetical protein